MGERDDREEIRDLLVRYARCLDLHDFAGAGECFTEDAVAEFSGVVLEPGASAIARHLEGLRRFRASTHLISNVLIELHGAEAEVSSQAVVHLLLRDRIRVRGLFYEDRVIRGLSGWRIAERHHRADWSIELPLRPS